MKRARAQFTARVSLSLLAPNESLHLLSRFFFFFPSRPIDRTVTRRFGFISPASGQCDFFLIVQHVARYNVV